MIRAYAHATWRKLNAQTFVMWKKKATRKFPYLRYVLHILKQYQSHYYRIEEKFWERKLLRISRFCGYLRKFSLQILGHVWHPLAAQVNIRESFLYENRQFAKVFSLESFPLYSIYMYTCHIWVPDKTWFLSKWLCKRSIQAVHPIYVSVNTQIRTSWYLSLHLY